MTIQTVAAELPRDRYGRPLVSPPDGGKPVAYTRCTTYVSVLEDTFNLNKWMQRMVALGLASRPDLLLAVAGAGDDKRALNKICEDAREAASASAAATTGTALHSLTEMLDRGQELPPIPDAYRADIEAYKVATDGLTAIHIEQFSVLDDLKIGGTPDRVVEVGGKRYIADLKTGSIEYGIGKIAMQLAVYSRSTGYDHTTSSRFDLGDIDQSTGIVIHLPAGSGTCELVEVDLNAGWEAVQLATQVRDWRTRRGIKRPYSLEATRANNPLVDRLAELIATAETADALYDLWSKNQQAWTPELSELAAARKALVEHKLAG